jgi:uncharacterized protein involved in outer membrane biogenesis
VARIARYLAYALLGLLVLAVAAALALPPLLDTPRMRAQIEGKLSAAVKGEVRWEKFVLRLLPSPQGTLRGLQVQTPAASLAAEEVAVSLRLWPLLLHGQPEITSVSVVRPALRIAGPRRAKDEAAPPASAERRTGALVAYRSAIAALVESLQDFAPDTRFSMDEARLSLRVEGIPPIELSEVNVHARTGGSGVELDASAASPYWSAMKLVGRVNYSDLSSSAELGLTQIKAQAWLDWLLGSAPVAVSLPSADLNARFRGDVAKALELDIDADAARLALAQNARRIAFPTVTLKGKLIAEESQVSLELANASLGASGFSDGVLRYSPKDKSVAGGAAYQLDLAQVAEYARDLVPDVMDRVESASGNLQGRVEVALRGDERRVAVSIDKSDAALEVKDVPGPLRVEKAVFEIDARTAKIERAALSIPAGQLRLSTLRYSLADGAAAASGEFDLDLERSLAVVRGLAPKGALDVIESAQGRARGRVQAAYSKKTWSAALDIADSDSRVQVRGLPGAAGITGVSVRATPNAVTVERARVTLLDSSASASAKLSDFDKGPRVEGSVAEALVGAKLLDWVWQTAKIPPGFEPKAPIRLALPQLAWAAKRPLQVKGSARFDAGPALAVDVAWSPELLEVRSATIKDQRSDASVALRSKGGVIEGKYAGTLDSRSIAALLKGAIAQSGALSGELRFRFDRKQPERTSADGSLKGENLDLTWLAGKPAKVSRIDISADDSGLKIGEAAVEWAGQRATLSGTAKRGEKGPVIDAQIDSPGVLVDAFLPEKPKEPAKAAAADKAGEKQKTEKAPALWPLPLTGKIALRSEFLQYTHLKLAPVAATLVVEENRAHLDLTQGQLCGIAVPFTFEATPKGFAATTKLSATKQPIEQTAKCLSGEKVQITGVLDLTANLGTEGKLDELVKNLGGTVNADLRNGEVMKFALIGNILSMKNVVALAEQGGPKLGSEGFPFRQLSARGRFEKGTFVLEEGVFHSNAVGLGATGWISLADYQSNLTVLVAPLALLDEAVRKLPVLGYIAGGSFTSLPVSVRGDIRDPTVVPLGPGAITKDLMGIFTRTLSLPGKLAPADTPQR